MSYRLEFGQWVPYPLEEVFLFFADPRNLPRIMPPATGTRIEHLSLARLLRLARHIQFSRLAR